MEKQKYTLIMYPRTYMLRNVVTGRIVKFSSAGQAVKHVNDNDGILLNEDCLVDSYRNLLNNHPDKHILSWEN